MDKKSVKWALTALILGIVVFSAAACSFWKKPDEDVIPAEGAVDDLWFSASKTEIGYSAYGQPNVDDLYCHTLGDGEHIVITAITDPGEYEVSNNHIEIVTVGISDGSVDVTVDFDTVKTIMIDNNMAIYGDYVDSVVLPFSYDGEDYIQLLNPSDYENGYLSVCYYSVTASGGCEGPVDLDALEFSQTPVITGSFTIGNETVLTASDSVGWIFSEDQKINTSLYLCPADSEPVEIDLDELLGEDLFMISDISSLSEGSILISYRTSMMSDIRRKAIDISDAASPQVQEDGVIPECINDMDAIYTLADGTVCMSNDEALYFLGEDGEAVKAVDYAQAGYSMAGFRNMRLVKRNDDGSLVFLANELSESGSAYDTLYSGVWSLVTLTPREADTRQILRIGVTDIVTDRVGRVVNDFNNSNETYYARIELLGREDSDYQINMTYADVPEDEYGAYLGILCNNTDIMKERLMTDPPDVFISGDILMNEPSTDLFMDLNTYIDSPSGLDRSEYYDNIFRLAESDGMLFHMPVAFYLSGIQQTIPEGEPTEYSGITYQEYEDLTGEYGGWDPIRYYCTPDTYAEELMSVQYDLFVDRLHGTANFHNAAFYALMDYIADVGDYYSPNGSNTVTVIYIDSETSDNMGMLDYGNIYFAGDDFSMIGYTEENTRWYGLPTYDGRGVSAGAMVTEAIPVNAADPDGAWEFIKFSISEQAQSADLNAIGLSVNRAAVQACRDTCESAFDVDGMIENAGSYYVTDIELRYICHQAIGAYIRGECSADEAADIIENYMLEIMGSSGR